MIIVELVYMTDVNGNNMIDQVFSQRLDSEVDEVSYAGLEI